MLYTAGNNSTIRLKYNPKLVVKVQESFNFTRPRLVRYLFDKAGHWIEYSVRFP